MLVLEAFEVKREKPTSVVELEAFDAVLIIESAVWPAAVRGGGGSGFAQMSKECYGNECAYACAYVYPPGPVKGHTATKVTLSTVTTNPPTLKVIRRFGFAYSPVL